MNDDIGNKPIESNDMTNTSDKSSEHEDHEEDIRLDLPQETDPFDDFIDLQESLKQQVNDELTHSQTPNKNKAKKKRIQKIAKAAGITGAVLILCAVFLIATPWGRGILYKVASNFIYQSIDKDNNNDNSIVRPVDEANNNKPDDDETPQNNLSHNLVARGEDYVTNYLIFGIEEIEGARNTDTMMIASINTKDNTVKLTSLMRDTYLQNPGESPTKLNAVYAKGGVDNLIKTVEQNYKIEIDGYAYINFSSFENIVDRLGGISIELGVKEANYLNRTNYISNRALRNVHPGMNNLVGNQVLGYCRIRKVETIEGVHDDYGRTLRQRKVLEAIFNKYKSKNVIQLVTIMRDCLGDISTNLSQKQIEQAIEDVVENKITTMNTMRIPIDHTFTTPDDYNGVNDPLVIEWDTNLKEFYQFVFNDTEEQAAKEVAERLK